MFTVLLSFKKISLYPIQSPMYSIGRSDGRCVQKAGTHSNNVIDLDLLDIPGLYIKISMCKPNYKSAS